jgi:hypothetical protein
VLAGHRDTREDIMARKKLVLQKRMTPSQDLARRFEAMGDRISTLCAHIDAAMHELLTEIRAFDQSGAWQAQGAQSCAHWLGWRVGMSPGAAREKVRVANRLGELSLGTTRK